MTDDLERIIEKSQNEIDDLLYENRVIKQIIIDVIDGQTVGDLHKFTGLSIPRCEQIVKWFEELQ